jgi:ribosomal protein L32
MISALKILFTIAVIVIVYWGFKYRWRMQDMGKGVREARRKRAEAKGASGPPSTTSAQDLEQCPKCGSYIPAGSTCSCQKS